MLSCPAEEQMRTPQTASEETTVYRRGERTALCAVCHGEGLRTPSTHDCPGCGIPLCPEHIPTGRRVCADCAVVVGERQQNWGFASTRLAVLFWGALGAFFLALVGLLTRSCHPNICRWHGLMVVALLVLAVLLICLFAVAADYRSRARGEDEGQCLDERAFARELRRAIVCRRVRD